MAVRNMLTSQRKKQTDAIRRAQTASPIGYSSVEEGGLRIASQEGLTVQGSQRVTGQLYVTGTEEVSGQLRVTGSLVVSGNADVTGPMSIRGLLTVNGSTTFVGPLRIEGSAAIVGPLAIEGDVDVTGPFTISGPMDITGDLTVTGTTNFTGDTKFDGKTEFVGDMAIKGDTDLTGDMKVLSGGKVTVGTIVMDPNGGETGNGSIYSSIALELSAPTVVTSSGLFARGSITTESYLSAPGTSSKSGATANLHMDSNGRIFRT